MNRNENESLDSVIKTQPVAIFQVDTESKESPSGSSTEFSTLNGRKSVLVHQLLDVVEVLLGWQRVSRYQVLDDDDKQIIYIYEVADCYARQFLGGLREYILKITDDDGVDILSVHRPLRCTNRCCWACCSLQELEILDSFGKIIATVQEVWSCITPIYNVLDASEELLYTIVGENCHCACCSNIAFQVRSKSGNVLSTITKIWGGCRDVIGAANDFKIEFDEQLPAQQRFIILGASFLIDSNYFQTHNRCWC